MARSEELNLEFFKKHGAQGGRIGAKKYWASLTPEQRSERAKKAAQNISKAKRLARAKKASAAAAKKRRAAKKEKR